MRAGLRTILLCSLVPLLGGVSAVRAEVGAVINLSGPSLVYVFTIIEDPSPINTIWYRHRLSLSGFAVLNAEGAERGDGPPTILGMASGTLVAWSMHTPSGYDVVASRLENGAWSAPVTLAGGPADQLDPVLVQAADGTVHLVYWEATAVPRVLDRTAPADLSAWSQPVQVSPAGVAACRPSAVVHDGVLHVAYELHDAGFGQVPRSIAVATNEPGGFVQEVVAVSQNPAENWPQVHSRGGRFWVDWIDGPAQMLWTRRDENGSWTTIRAEGYDGLMQREFFVRGTIQTLAGQ